MEKEAYGCWHSMDSAPKDGEAILLLTEDRCPLVAFWDSWETGGGDHDSGWCLNGAHQIVLIGEMIAWARIYLPKT